MYNITLEDYDTLFQLQGVYVENLKQVQKLVIWQ